MLQVRNLTLTLAGQPLLRAVNFVVPPAKL